MMDLITLAFRNVLEVSLAMAAVMAVLLLCRPLFQKRYRAKWAYWAWLLVAVRLLVPVNLQLPAVKAVSVPTPGVSVNLPVAFEPKNKAQLEDTLGQPGADSSPKGNVAAGALPIQKTIMMDGWTVVACVWLLGFGCALILQFVPYFRFRRQVRRWSTPLDGAEAEALGAAVDAPRLRLARCSAIAVPMVSGFFRPTLLIPAEGDVPAEPILRHEVVHYQRLDLWYKLLILLAQCVHWFNPLVWLMGPAANRDLERACDEAVTAGRSEEYRAGYGRAILDAMDVAQPQGTPLTSYFHGGKKAMLERLTSILNTEGKKRGVAVLCLLLVAAILGSACFAVGRGVVAEDDEFQIMLPYGTTWKEPEFKPGLNAQFYQNGVEAGGLVGVAGSLAEMRELWTEQPNDYAMFGDSLLDTATIPVWEGELRREGAAYDEVHYYFYVAENQICDLWFRLDMVTRREARTAAESFLKNLGAMREKSPDGRYDLSYLVTDEGSRWLLRDRGELVGAVTTEGNYVWQTAQWSPDGRWAAVQSTKGIVVLSPGPDGLGIKSFSTTDGVDIPLGWGKDNRLQYSYVLETGIGLEGGTSWFDPATDTIEDMVVEAECAPVEFHSQPKSDDLFVRNHVWTIHLPADVTVERDENGVDAALMRGGEKIGLVRWVTLSQGERAGNYGLSKVYSDFDELGGGAAYGYTFPVEGAEGYELVLKESAFRQNLANAIAHRVLVDGKNVFQYVYDEGASGESATLWTRQFSGYSVSLRQTAGQMEFLLEREGARTVLQTLDYDATHPYFPYVDAYAFQNVMGQDGFVLFYPTGLAWNNYDYYGMDKDGTPTLLAECYNAVYELDVNGDGTNELLSNYHNQAYADLHMLRSAGPVKLDICAAADAKLGRPAGTCGLTYEEQTDRGLKFEVVSRTPGIEIPAGTTVVLTLDEILTANEGTPGEVTLAVEYLPGGESATGAWYNAADAEIMYGSMFSLEVLKDGAWETVPYADGESKAFTSVGYLLKPYESAEKNYPIKDFYGVLPAGQYRICEYYSMDLGLGKYSEKIRLYGAFRVE